MAVIENEFGEIGVDDSLVENKTGGGDEILEMMNGCICCTVRTDLANVLKKLAFRALEGRLEGIIVETTGMANPAPVTQTFFVEHDIRMLYNLDGILTVVDCKHILLHLDEKPQGEDEENESEQQIAFADRVLLNKIDLVDEAELKTIEERVMAVNAHVRVYKTR